MPHAQRILIVRLSHLGDVVHALPLVPALRAAHPDARIAWAVQPEYAGLLRGLDGLDAIVPFDRRGGAGAWFALARELEAFGADWSIDAQGNVKSAMVALASRAPRRSGFARVDWTEPFAATSVNDPAPAAPRADDGARHAMERMHALLAHVAPGHDAPLRWPRDLCEPDGDELLGRWIGPRRGPLAVLHLAGQRDVRAWPASAFVAVARDLAADHDVLVLAGPGEEAEGLAAARALRTEPRIACVPDQRGLPELAAALRSAARREAVFLGCDSGPMHLAWSVGLPVVLLAGPQDERRTGPWPVPGGPPGSSEPASRAHRVVRAAIQPECAPCLARGCAHPRGPVCMTGIEPARAAAAVRSLSRARRVLRAHAPITEPATSPAR